MSHHPITILLADDHTIVREGLRRLLELEDGISVVGEASTGRETVALTRRLRPAIVLMDIAMPGLNGLEATRQIRKAVPGVKVLILSAHSDDAYVEQAMTMGAAGYLLKQSSARVLSEAVHTILKGETFFCPSITRHLNRRGGAAPGLREPTGRKPAGLSAREMEVLQLIAEGRANKQVAQELGISHKTVEKHRQRVMEKLDIHDTAGLTRYAIATGIIETAVVLNVPRGSGARPSPG